MLTKKIAKGHASPSQKATPAKAQASMPSKQAFAGPQVGRMTPVATAVNVAKGRATAKLTQASIKKASALTTPPKKGVASSMIPADFFAVMDELDSDARTRRAAALKVMEKAVAK